MTIPSAPVDTDTADALALVDGDVVHRSDREVIVTAIEEVAGQHEGRVDPNELRRVIAGQVQPQVIGAVVQGLARRGHLEPDGFTITEGSSSGNNGRPARVWRWVG